MSSEIWNQYRGEAIELGEQRDKLFESSQKAYLRGDGLKAKKDSILGSQYQKRCDEANELAANAIFMHYNKNRDLTSIDLHGLFVKEAEKRLEDHIVNAIQNCVFRLDVIVGQGLHSEHGPKIKPTVERFAKLHNIPCKIDNVNRGCIRLNLAENVILSQMAIKRVAIQHTRPYSSMEKPCEFMGYPITRRKKPKNNKRKSLKSPTTEAAFTKSNNNLPSKSPVPTVQQDSLSKHSAPQNLLSPGPAANSKAEKKRRYCTDKSENLVSPDPAADPEENQRLNSKNNGNRKSPSDSLKRAHQDSSSDSAANRSEKCPIKKKKKNFIPNPRTVESSEHYSTHKLIVSVASYCILAMSFFYLFV